MNGLYTNLLIRLRPESVAFPRPSVKMLSARPFCFYRLCIMKQRKLTPVGPEWIMKKKKTFKWIGIGQSWGKKRNKTGALRDSAGDAERASAHSPNSPKNLLNLLSCSCIFFTAKYEGQDSRWLIHRSLGWWVGVYSSPMHTHEHAWLDIQIMNVFLCQASSRTHSVVTNNYIY